VLKKGQVEGEGDFIQESGGVAKRRYLNVFSEKRYQILLFDTC
jgi:hypothetical protein